jgi:magnesium transporter
LHPLVLEDILNTNQRPKLEDYGDYLYIVLKRLFRGDNGRVGTEQVSLILGANFVISFQEGIRGDLFTTVKERIRSGKGKIRGMGADYLAYSLMDTVVDTYFDVIDGAEETIEALEDEVTFSPTPKTVRELHRLKREMIALRKAVWPLREVLASLTRRESKLVSEPVAVYLRDVYDHTIHVNDSIESGRDMLSGMLDIYLSSMSNRLNEVMKVLTLFATIFMPITFIVGLYGMNFKYMPELEWPWGYPAVMFLMVAVTAGMVIWFRRRKWL